MRGAIPTEVGSVEKVAQDIHKWLKEYGVEKKPVGMDIADIPLVRALEKLGLEITDGQQTILEARMIKTKDEIELLKTSAAMVDAAFEEVVRTIRPGMRENDLVAAANYLLYKLGSDDVECVNSVAGKRGIPHPHTFSDRIIRPGEFVYLDIMHSYMGYRTCYYRTFACGKPTKAQVEAYETAWKWLKDSIAAVKPGATTADVAKAWPEPEAYGIEDRTRGFSPSVWTWSGAQHLGETRYLEALLPPVSLSDPGGNGLCHGDLLSIGRWEGIGKDRGGGRSDEEWV